MTKAVFKWIGKAAGAGLLALGLLCLFCWFYYNVPVHYTNESGATEYKWETHRFYSKGDEGFAWGRTNNDGFNNLRDYTPGEAVDVLMMGSSHMEGFNVAQEENAAALLNGLYAGKRYVYNIGMAGHNLLYCFKHLDRALAHYAPSGWVVIETMTLDLSAADMDAVLDGSYPELPSRTGGVFTLLQRLPALRLIYSRYFKGGELFADDGGAQPAAEPAGSYAASLDRLLDKAATESAAHGVRAMIAFMPPLFAAEDGSVYTETDPAQLALFTRLCADKGIEFIDLTGAYLDAYAHHVLPFGFSNTAPFVGHLNREGHRILAEAVAARIAEREG